MPLLECWTSREDINNKFICNYVVDHSWDFLGLLETMKDHFSNNELHSSVEIVTLDAIAPLGIGLEPS